MNIGDLFEGKAKTLKVGVVGLGYVGLPLALTFGRAGLSVVGFDVDATKIDKINRGESYIKHIASEPISAAVKSGKLIATLDFARAKECDALLICVPTPLNKHREPDMSFVADTTRALAPHLRKEQLVVLESTTYPGTTDELVRPILEAASGLTAGPDFALAFSPEREDPGNASFDTQRIPKLVGGHTESCKRAAVALYATALDKVVAVSGTRVAETAKLLENVFRSVNIALVNELKVLCDRMGIDVWEVIEAASTKPFGFMPFFPGPGLGGHCIPIDPFYLTWKAREFEMSTRFIELAGEINTTMPRYVVDRAAEALNNHSKAMRGARILVLGLAYKKDIDDARESPALRVIELLRERGAVVDYHDPYIARAPIGHGVDLDMTSVELSDERLAGSDAVLIITDHSNIDYQRLVAKAPLVIDTRNATRKVQAHRERIFKA